MPGTLLKGINGILVRPKKTRYCPTSNCLYAPPPRLPPNPPNCCGRLRRRRKKGRRNCCAPRRGAGRQRHETTATRGKDNSLVSVRCSSGGFGRVPDLGCCMVLSERSDSSTFARVTA